MMTLSKLSVKEENNLHDFKRGINNICIYTKTQINFIIVVKARKKLFW